MTPRVIILVVLSLAVAAARIAGVKHEAFQAIAHLFVGGLIGAWLIDPRKLYVNAFGSLCLVEVVCFLFDRVL